MLRLTKVIMCAMVLLAGLCYAADDYPIKVYPCPEVDTQVTVDGDLDEEQWQQAPLVGGFTYYDRQKLVEPQTFFRVVNTPRGICFGITCDEPDMEKLSPLQQVRDAHAIFSTEAIEIFIDPNHDHRTYYQFAVNAAASIYDSKKQDRLWNSDAMAATTMLNDSWTVEFLIPWAGLRIEPQEGMVIGFNVCRDRVIVNKQWSNWSQTKANFHDPKRFAHLALSPTAEQLGELGGEFRQPDRNGPIVVFGKSGFSDKSYRALVDAAIADVKDRLQELKRVRNKEPNRNIARELGNLIDNYEKKIKQVQQELAGKQQIEADKWFHIQLQVNDMSTEMDTAVWKARLRGLLREI